MNEKISNFQQVASLRRYTLTEGISNGIEVIDCDNGNIRFLLNVTKALDIMQLYHEGQNVSFICKNGFTKREIAFGKRFEGGMLYTCGLDCVGGIPGHEPHGSFHTTPAEVVRAECNEDGIVVEALIRDTALMGNNLVMRRKITSAIGSDKLVLEDTLLNAGYRETNYALLYHINVGYPLLDEGAKIIADVKAREAVGEWAAKNEATASEIEAPIPGREETCYYLTLGKPEASLLNEKLGKKFTVSYSADTLPLFLEWKSMASGDYVLGLEPCTTKTGDAFAYKTIAAGETVKFSVALKVEKV